MRIEVENFTDLPVKNVHYLSEKVIRFQLESPTELSGYERLLLGEYESIEQIHPGAPNRSAVEYNLDRMRRGLEESLAEMTQNAVAEERAIRTAKDLLLFHVEHLHRPTYLYTNCQAFVSVVARSSTRFEVLFHPSSAGFGGSSCFYGPRFGPEDTAVVATLEHADAAANKRLSNVRIQTLQLRKGSENEILYLQSAGRRNMVETQIATFRGEEFPFLMGGLDEPFQVLNNLRPDGFVIEACATCRFFRFSGLTRDWSNGSVGYCQHPNLGSEVPRVSVFHYCSDYSFIEKRSPLVAAATQNS